MSIDMRIETGYTEDMTTTHTITTWADGFGRWHARVNFTPAAGTYSQRITKGTAAAKRAIRNEINQRVTQRDYRLRYAEVDSVETADGSLESITIVEA